MSCALPLVPPRVFKPLQDNWIENRASPSSHFWETKNDPSALEGSQCRVKTLIRWRQDDASKDFLLGNFMPLFEKDKGAREYLVLESSDCNAMVALNIPLNLKYFWKTRLKEWSKKERQFEGAFSFPVLHHLYESPHKQKYSSAWKIPVSGFSKQNSEVVSKYSYADVFKLCSW